MHLCRPRIIITLRYGYDPNRPPKDRTSPTPLKSRRYPIWVILFVPVGLFLHQSSWLWSDHRLVGGLPVNLLYHIILSVLWSLIMLFVVRRAWPRYLDKE